MSVPGGPVAKEESADRRDTVLTHLYGQEEHKLIEEKVYLLVGQ